MRLSPLLILSIPTVNRINIARLNLRLAHRSPGGYYKMADEHKVYLDHLIERENLRYRRSEEHAEYGQAKQNTLRLSDLTGEPGKYLRKPDFQRATWAWTPEDCVSLIDSVINGQVIPSLIMWTSPDNGYDYILDGGHRVSAVLAWLKDDWGEKYAEENIDDPEQELIIKQASKDVQSLIRSRIGDIETYKAAEEALVAAVRDGKSPRAVLDEITFNRGLFYQGLLKGAVSFHVLWVRGDYKTAEQSFLKINKSGRQLTDWETILVENRNSSFARSVMAISSGNTAPHYWPEDVSGTGLQTKITDILDGVKYLQSTLFQPRYSTPIQRLQQPFLVASVSDRPRYIAELLTITEGFRGQEPETEKLMKKNPNAEPQQIIEEGWDLIAKAVDIFQHLNGPSTQPKSLAIVPALYFYTDAGRYVRSLLYGFIYWMFMGSENDILNRKRLFSTYRGSFEAILRANKNDVVGTISRRTGSGPEVTVLTAAYYNQLLELLIKYEGGISSDDFRSDYGQVMKRFNPSGMSRQSVPLISLSRSFTEKQKSMALLSRILDRVLPCDICGGMLDPEGSVQHDHIIMHSQGGPTSSENHRVVHPFCNNQRVSIEGYMNRSNNIELPEFVYLQDDPEGPTQLLLFPDSAFE